MLRKTLFRILLLCFTVLFLSCTPLVSRKSGSISVTVPQEAVSRVAARAGGDAVYTVNCIVTGDYFARLSQSCTETSLPQCTFTVSDIPAGAEISVQINIKASDGETAESLVYTGGSSVLKVKPGVNTAVIRLTGDDTQRLQHPVLRCRNTAVIRLTGDDTASVTVGEETLAVSWVKKDGEEQLVYSDDVLEVPVVWKTIEFGGVWSSSGRLPEGTYEWYLNGVLQGTESRFVLDFTENLNVYGFGSDKSNVLRLFVTEGDVSASAELNFRIIDSGNR